MKFPTPDILRFEVEVAAGEPGVAKTLEQAASN
jgi:hypothetical protein